MMVRANEAIAEVLAALNHEREKRKAQAAEIERLRSEIEDHIALYAMDLACRRGHAETQEIEDITFRLNKARAALNPTGEA